MANIGGIAMFSVTTPIQLTDRELVEDHRPGVDGIDLQDIGIRGKTFPVNAIGVFTSDAARNSARSAFRNMGTNNSIITIVDDLGVSFFLFVVKSFNVTQIRNTVGATGGADYRMDITMDVIATATSYSA